MKKVESRTIWYAALFLLGAVLFILAELMSMIDSFWSGMGIGFVIIAAVRIAQLGRYKNDAEYAKKITVKNNDERNQYLATKARSSSFYYSILMEGIAIIILQIVGSSEIAQVIAMVLCGQLLIYWASYFMLKSKY